MNLVAVTSCPTGIAHTLLAAEALKKTAASLGHHLLVETQGSVGAKNVLTEREIAEADAVIIAADVHVDTGRFSGKPLFETRTAEAIRNTATVIESALTLVSKPVAEPSAPAAPMIEAAAVGASRKQLVGITSCPTGIAHTFMAAAALEKAAKALGYAIKVETQGSVGAKNQLSAEDIAAADAVIIAADTKVDLSRFAGKPLYSTSTKAAMHDGQAVIKTALAQPVGGSPNLAEAVEQAKAERSKSRTGAYKHLMTGVSYMLPVVIAGGLAIALAFAIGGIHAGDHPETLAGALSQIGGATAFHLFVAVLSAFIAYSVADRPGIAPGLVGGMLAQNLGAGFLGGIASGFLAGYLTRFLAEKIKLPVNLEGLKPVLILPFVATISVGLLMIYVVAPPVHGLNQAMNDWLNSMRGANALLLGVLLGGMMAFDMGGPVNKAAYTFAVGLLASKIYTPMAAVMAGGMTPALGLGLAAFLFKKRFDNEEREAGGPALVLGLSFITEGAIPFAAKDPFRVIPALVLGSATAGAISMVSGVQLLVPHGGIFAVLIPGAVTHLLPYLSAIVTGTVVTTAALFVLKKPVRA
ncbi:PTS system, fructose subfamily, IIC subunit [Chthoniobacter flavus Ellin428]|uniref:protein-N(pi)-phosphohistidine--D-fructose phosphotransferase n=1 Tax=Chthoniobacter flavus Ellin428 TaxID=497964 RepID=B4D0F6_9BACT|nr:PTS fructose-like transporter subunit IIB [Chthoniobacter flavus]EDY19818.1 PTS system, fructose subfamily, IIC subunit [Chthoniobacter flavus Ellin428]TCO91907.1 PTS system D-fructose-specific IIB component (F1P-forming) (Frc family) /PTS system D-fructose-specific IIC component (F1P-forming) (Frc family) [Chthoniobacter flavus]